MLVRLGNSTPHQCVTTDGSHTHESILGPAVTYLNIPDGDHEDGSALYGVKSCDETSASETVTNLALHLVRNPDITRLAGHEAFLCIAHPSNGAWQHHGKNVPTWVWSDNVHLATLLSAFYNCPVYSDEQVEAVEDTHYTLAGAPGVVPGAKLDLSMNITQNGRDICAQALGGGQVGAVGQATASGATTLTTGSTYTTNQWAGYRVAASVSATVMVWGNIISNTNAANASVLTVDRWYTPSTPGGAAGSTPSATATFIILDGSAPAWFMGLTANSGAPASPSTATSLASEITTSGGGLIRKICPWAHTASASTYTLTPVFTANGSDSLPVTVAKIGVFNSMVSTDATQTMLFETLLNVTATLSASGDQLTATETVTLT